METAARANSLGYSTWTRDVSIGDSHRSAPPGCVMQNPLVESRSA